MLVSIYYEVTRGFFCNQKFYSFNPKGLMWSTRDRLLDKFLKKKRKKGRDKVQSI